MIRYFFVFKIWKERKDDLIVFGAKESVEELVFTCVSNGTVASAVFFTLAPMFTPRLLRTIEPKVTLTALHTGTCTQHREDANYT